MKKMTVIGVGEKLAIPTFAWLGAAIVLHYVFFPVFAFSRKPSPVLIAIGIVLVAAGLTVNFVSAFLMVKGFKKGKLVTTGPFALSRNPMYSSFVFLTLPGLGLILNSWLVLTASVVLYLMFVLFIRGEEEWLAKKFGKAFKTYQSRAGLLLPKIGK